MQSSYIHKVKILYKVHVPVCDSSGWINKYREITTNLPCVMRQKMASIDNLSNKLFHPVAIFKINFQISPRFIHINYIYKDILHLHSSWIPASSASDHIFICTYIISQGLIWEVMMEGLDSLRFIGVKSSHLTKIFMDYIHIKVPMNVHYLRVRSTNSFILTGAFVLSGRTLYVDFRSWFTVWDPIQCCLGSNIQINL